MGAYLWFIIVLGAVVDLLLLIGAGMLAGYPPDRRRLLPAGMLAGLYAGAMASRSLYFLGNWYWRLIFMALISAIGFGLDSFVIRKGSLYVLLRLALDGIAAGIDRGGHWAVGAGALGLCLVCSMSLRGSVCKRYVSVKLPHDGQALCLRALRDTGNALRDPLTGHSVMVVGPEIARKLTGLTPEQLRTPTHSLKHLPGGRLIPFKTISQTGGLLLALPVSGVQIGSWRGRCLVAFAPERLGNGEFEALTGG